jgi:ribosomal protein S2
MKKSFQGFINLEKKTVFKKNSSISITLKKQTSSMPTSKSEIFKIGREVDWKPDLIFILNSNSAESIIKEACNLKIPIIALTDSNTNISNITYPIPTNTNSFFFAWFCLDYITKLVNKYSKF